MGLSVKEGSVFGYLTVLEETGKRIRGAKVWKCRCSCGKVVEAKTDYLQQGWKRSCGCLRSQKASARIPELLALKNKNPKSVYKLNTFIRNTKSGAKKRNLEYSLSDKEVFDLISKPCHYCGFLDFTKKGMESSTKYSEWFNGIDRKDNKKGYTKENSLPCCKICNRAKNNMEYEDFLRYIFRIQRKNGITK